MTLIDGRIGTVLDEDGMSADERRQFQVLEANRVLGLIMRRVPVGFRIGDWLIRDSIAHLTAGIEVMLSYDTDHAKRAKIMALSEQFGFEYTEQPHGTGQNVIAATGFYQSVPVKFWQLVNPCDCGCSTEATS